ncbi:response regulator transcription factor [Actinokineospora sp. G85]|uniref:response regulator transcription factor n=1 Tax=Actinokineospora sp. G85 TaxID=3406626 RepID=UPI003C71B2FA
MTALLEPASRHTDAAVSRHHGLDALLAEATAEVLVLSGQTAACPTGPARRIDHHNLRRGVAYRVVVPDLARTAPGLGPRLVGLAAAGADTRTVPEVPTDVVVVDREAVILPNEATGVAVLRLPGVVDGMVGLFERVWATAVPLIATGVPGRSELTGRERALLELLAAGCTDDAAALKLEVSVRTVRRMVADITNRLGARSRFQAGAKAAARGWLPA